jgi:hypothetical protein
MEKHSIINSHNSWSQLEEVWLGDVYPSSWYDHLDSEVRDVFQKLTEITQQDLNSIQRKLEEFNIVVRRPEYHSIDQYIDENDNLIKPEICPRDTNVVIGNTLYRLNNRYRCWDHVLKQYQNVKFAPHSVVNGANVVRAGRDIVIDTDVFDWQYHNEFPEYRVRLVKNGGHMDGCFAVLKPGLILANHYFDDYETTFPGWQVIMLDNPTYAAGPSRGYAQPYPVYNGKFYDTTVGINHSFNQHIVQHALDWVGNYTETYFELNCLVVNESNVIMLAENHQLAQDLDAHGITVHWVPFRTRSFWDGGVHCLTVDIRRQSTIVDYFPERS